MKFLKTKDWHLIKNFSRFFKPHKKWFFYTVATIPFTTAGGLVFLWLIERIIDDYIIPGDVAGLKIYVLYLAIALVLNYLFDSIYTYSFTKAGNLAIRDMRKALFGKTIRFPLQYYDKNPIGVTLSRLTSDMESLNESFAGGILSLLSDSIKTIALTSYLFYINWQLTLVVLIVLPPIILVIKYLRKRIRNAYNIARKSLAQAAGYLQESLNGIKTVQLYSAEKETFKRFDKLNKKFCEAQNKSNVFDAALFSVIEGITSIAVGLVIWYGAIQIWDFNYTMGVLIVFVTTLNRLFIPVKHFTQQISTIQRSLSALEHINSLFEQKLEEDPVAEKADAKLDEEFNEIVFKDVWFSYSEDGPDILKGISFTLKKGQRIALVGSTGSGKSTIIKVLTKTYTGYRGSITINGVELSSIPLAKINKIVSLMQQDIFMFNDSIGFNISLNRAGITNEDVEKAASFVYADKFIKELPETYNYQIQDNGANLSKGQSQLVSFARSICGESELIILDEATSAVDSLTETYIQKAIENIFSQKTVIAVAHRLSTIKHSDQILVLENGQIIEQGTHDELAATGGKYAQLLNEFAGSTVE
jgi:ATP-binding cassette, subfamily B, multidrug efflux pump